jgi:hypothetical protein
VTEQLNLDLSTNWVFRWNTNIPKTPGRFPNSHIPIDDQTVPIQFESTLIAVKATSSTALAHWRYAATAIQKVSTGIGSLSVPDAEANYTKKVYLDRLQLLFFPKLATTYSLTFKIPYWLSAINIDVWEYVGEGTNFTTQALINIENKIDQLL